MSKAIIFLLFSLAIAVHSVYSLTCYACSSQDAKCLQQANHRAVVCGQSVSGFKPVCSYVETYDPYKRMYNVQAGCEIISIQTYIETAKRNICSRPSNINVNKCIVCENNYCNTGYY